MSQRAIALLAAALASTACRGRHDSGRGAVGTATAAALGAGLADAARVRAPWRCAALDTSPPTAGAIAVGSARWTIADRTITRSPAGPVVRIGFVADAEAPTPATLTALAGLRAHLAAAGVDAIVALGGMGGSQAELEATLGALAGDTLVVAIPGDREPAAGHRAAMAALAARAVVDGAAVRWLVVDGVAVATLPGQPFAARLAHGVEGCGHRAADVGAILATAPAGARVRVLASQEAPRHPDAADRGALGAPAGDLALAAALAASPVDVVVHATLDGLPTPAGRRAAAPRPVVLATGVASAGARLDAAGRRVAPAALVLTIEGTHVSWQPIAP